MSMFDSARTTDKVQNDSPIPSWRDHPRVQESEQRIAEYAKRYSALVEQHQLAHDAVESAQAHADEVQKLYLQGAATKAERDAARQGVQHATTQLEAAEDAVSECARDLRLLREGQHEMADAAKRVVIAKLRAQYAAALTDLIHAFEALETANRRVRSVHEAAQFQFPGQLAEEGRGYPSSAGLQYFAWDDLFTPDGTPASAWASWMPPRDSQTYLARWLPEARQYLAQLDAMIQAEAKAQKENKAS